MSNKYVEYDPKKWNKVEKNFSAKPLSNNIAKYGKIRAIAWRIKKKNKYETTIRQHMLKIYENVHRKCLENIELCISFYFPLLFVSIY